PEVVSGYVEGGRWLWFSQGSPRPLQGPPGSISTPETSQKWTCPLQSPAAIRNGAGGWFAGSGFHGAKATPATGPSPQARASSRPLSISHKRTVPSLDPRKAKRPSGEKATECTKLVCPSSPSNLFSS